MTLILALVAALLGAVLGGLVGFFAVIALGVATGADRQQGALEIGAAATGLPVGATLGAIAAVVLVVRMRRARAPDPAPDARSEPARDGAQAAVTTKRIGPQGWVALGLVGAALLGGWVWLNDTGEPWRFRGASRPVLFVEIRVPADDPGIAWALDRGSDLRNGTVYHGTDGPMLRRKEGDHTVLTARHVIAYKTEDRSVELWLGQERLLVFDLDLARRPEEQPDFTDWRPVDHVRPHFYAEDVPGPHDYAIRTKVLWGGP